MKYIAPEVKLKKHEYKRKDVSNEKQKERRLRMEYIRKRSVDAAIIGSVKAVFTAIFTFATTALLDKYFGKD